MGAGGLGKLAHANKSIDAHAALGSVDFHHLFGSLAAIDRKHRMAELAVSKGMEQGVAAADKAHGNIGIAQQHLRNGVAHQSALIGGLFKETMAHRDIEEQVPHDDRRTLGTAGLHGIHVLAALAGKLHAALLALGTGGHLHAGNRRDGG